MFIQISQYEIQWFWGCSHHMQVFWERSKLCCQLGQLGHQHMTGLTSDFWPLTSDLWLLTSHFWPLTSHLWPLTSGLWPDSLDLCPVNRTIDLWPWWLCTKKSRLGQDGCTEFRMGKIGLTAEPGIGAPAVVRACCPPSSGEGGPIDPSRFL
jgi:hypothetical protein